MSATIPDGGLLLKDPSDAAVYQFDWGAQHLAAGVEIANSVWTLTGVGGDTVTTPVTKDQDAILAGNRKTRIRLTAGAPGSRWRLDNTIVTNESPAQTIERSVFIKVEQR